MHMVVGSSIVVGAIKCIKVHTDVFCESTIYIMRFFDYFLIFLL